MSVDPLADSPANIAWSPYTYVWNNPINAIDPDGRHGQWIPELDENSNLILKAEEGDNYKSLRKFLGKDNIFNLDAGQLYTKYQEMESSGSGSINFGTDNVISQTNIKLGNLKDGGSINCFDTAMALGGGNIPETNPGGSYLTAEEGMRRTQFANPNLYEDAGSTSNMKFGESLTSFGSKYFFLGFIELNPDVNHAATFMGTSRTGTNYYFSKNGLLNKGDFGIFTGDKLNSIYGTPVGFNKGQSGHYNSTY